MAKAIESLSSLDEQITKVNHRLKLAQLGLQIERRGKRLGLRGNFPPKPSHFGSTPHQQRLSLGLPADRIGLKQAERQIKIIAGQLLQGTFNWEDYVDLSKEERLSVVELTRKIEEFERHYLTTGIERGDRHPASVHTTWNGAYAPYFRKLMAIAQAQPNLSVVELIYEALETTRAHSRSRQVCCTALSALAEFMDLTLPHDLKEFWGLYNPSRAKERRLPSEEAIITGFGTIPNPEWRFVYGVMATYGLRNHEVFFCQYANLIQSDGDDYIEVLGSTKTGCHGVWPFYPEWVDTFNLREIQLPKIQTDLTQTSLQRIGQLVTCQFRRYGLPFSPYDLRHAWAVRTIHFGLPDTVAARMMGHSVAVHHRTYHQWLTHRDQSQAVQVALSHYRPISPSQ